MRKLLLIAATLCAVLCAGDSAYAFDVKNQFIISALGGVGIPLGNFADSDTSNLHAGGANTGFNLGLAVEYGITEQFLVGGRFAYSRFAGDPEIFKSSLPVEEFREGHWSVTEVFGVYAKYLFLPASPTRPFIRGGLFLGIPSARTDGFHSLPASQEFDVSLGFDAGLGVLHMLSDRIGLGIEGRFAHLGTNTSDAAEFSAELNRRARNFNAAGIRDPGGNLQWLAVNAVVSYGL